MIIVAEAVNALFVDGMEVAVLDLAVTSGPPSVYNYAIGFYIQWTL